MSNSFEDLRQCLKSTNYPVFRDKAPKNTKFPYIVYSFISEDEKKASNQSFKELPLYQVSLFTDGTEKDLVPIKKALNAKRIPFSSFGSIQGDENDDTITNFYTQVRCINDAG